MNDSDAAVCSRLSPPLVPIHRAPVFGSNSSALIWSFANPLFLAVNAVTVFPSEPIWTRPASVPTHTVFRESTATAVTTFEVKPSSVEYTRQSVTSNPPGREYVPCTALIPLSVAIHATPDRSTARSEILLLLISSCDSVEKGTIRSSSGWNGVPPSSRR